MKKKTPLVTDLGPILKIKTARFIKAEIAAWTIPLTGPEYVFIFLRDNSKEFSTKFSSAKEAEQVADWIDKFMMRYERQK